jgi:hypothetical protein
MEITIKQCEHKEVKKEGNVLYLDGCKYNDGDIIVGFIEKRYFEGRICITKERNHLLQNAKDGSRPDNSYKMLNFTKSWEFSVSSNSEFTSGVSLFNYKKESEFNINELELKFPLPNFMIDGYNRFVKKSGDNSLFQLTPIAHCCGATLLSDFKSNEEAEVYNVLDEEIVEIDLILRTNMTSNKIAYLLKTNESAAIAFLTEKLNFKIIDEFKNKNTSRTIQILSRNDLP